MTIREILAKNLRDNRQKQGLTQAALAERAEISTNFLAMIELKHKFPAPEILDRLSAALGIENYELFTTALPPESVMRKLHADILADMEKFQQAVINDLDKNVGKAVEKALAEQLKEMRSASFDYNASGYGYMVADPGGRKGK